MGFKRHQNSYSMLTFVFIFSFVLTISFCSDSKKITTDENNTDNPPVDIEEKEDIVYSHESIKVYEDSIIQVLTGIMEITEGIRLTDRNTLTSRSLVRSFLISELEKIGLTALKQIYSDEGQNVYAVLEATKNSDEYLILGAHFDSVQDCPGADDNASGVTLLTAVARSAAGITNRSKNIIFVYFDEEETGLKGSEKFAEKVITDNLNVHSMHNFDMLGWDSDKDRAIDLGHPYPGAAELYYAASDSTGLNIPVQVTTNLAGDHYRFYQKGIKVAGLEEEFDSGDRNPHYHKSTDNYDTLDRDYLFSSTVLVIEAMKILIKY